MSGTVDRGVATSGTAGYREVALLRAMVRVRRFEERCAELYSASAIRGFLHLYIGEEAVAVGVAEALEPTDAVVSTYREHGHALVRGVPMEAVLSEMFGKVTGCSRGRGGSMHLFDVSRRFYGGNAIVAGGLPLAAGLALAERLRDSDSVVVCFFGEGAMAEGEFHETVNLAALWRLPVLFCCENNLYAMGTALDRSQAMTDLALRASSYGIPAWPVDGMDVVAVADAAERAVRMVRGRGGPAFIEARTFRFRAHSMYDAERYREKAEVAAWKERDPITTLEARLRAQGVDEDALGQLRTEIEQSVEAELDAAVAAAEQAPLEPVEDLTRFVLTEDAGADR